MYGVQYVVHPREESLVTLPYASCRATLQPALIKYLLHVCISEILHRSFLSVAFSTTCFVTNIDRTGDPRNGRRDPAPSSLKREPRNTDFSPSIPRKDISTSQCTAATWVATVLIDCPVLLPFMDSVVMPSPPGPTKTATCGFEIPCPVICPTPEYGRTDMIQLWPGAAQSRAYKTLPAIFSRDFSVFKPLQASPNVLRSSFAIALAVL